MFKLRKEHLAAFEAQVVSLFASRVIAHVKAVWPAECGELGEPTVVEMVRGAIQRGAALGLSSEFDIVRFVDLAFILAKDFDANPLAAWTRPILADKTTAPTARLDKLYQRMEEEFALIEKRKTAKR
jgi:transaldolase